MESVEFEALLNDVETRLDRLKALYEQWFQGIERLEPTIVRKELDRRMVLLRKEQPRNTALRFRFQTIVQRYTTLQTYWVRVGRQIEEGTYRRDLLKARQSIIAARGARKRGGDVDTDAIEVSIGASADRKPASTKPSDAPLEGESTQPSAMPPARPALSPIAPPRPAAPGAAAPRVVSPFARAAARPADGTAAPRPTDAPGAASAPSPPSAAATATFARPGGSPPPAPARPPAPAPPSAPARLPAMATFARPGAGDGASRPAPPAPTASLTPSVPAATPPRPAPAPAQSAPARPAPPTPLPTPPRAAESLSEQDMRRVYDRYSEARRKNNEPAVTYDTLAKNLRDVAPKMSEKYGKPVDFEVVLKDGKVGLKPVPKG